MEINTFSTVSELLLSYGEKMNSSWRQHAVCFEVHNNARVTPTSLLIQQKRSAGLLDAFKNLYGCYRSELTRNVHKLHEPVSWLKLNKRWKAGIKGEVKKLAIRRRFYPPVNYPTGSLYVFISALFAPEAKGILGWIFYLGVCKLQATTYCKIRSSGREWKIWSWLRRYSEAFSNMTRIDSRPIVGSYWVYRPSTVIKK